MIHKNIYEIFLNCQSDKLLIVDDKVMLVVSPDKKIVKNLTNSIVAKIVVITLLYYSISEYNSPC